MSTNYILNKFQSGFRVQHSTETALLKVLNYIYLSVNSGNYVVLVLLDLSAAFDTINHSILISRLEHCIGLQGNVLKWFIAYLTNRSFSVNIANFTSSTTAPTLFFLYMLPLCDILEKRLGYVCNPRSLKEGTETSRRRTDELGSRVERPIHFECKLNEPMHIGMRLLHPAAADHSVSISRHIQLFAEEPSRGPAAQRWYRSRGDGT